MMMVVVVVVVMVVVVVVVVVVTTTVTTTTTTTIPPSPRCFSRRTDYESAPGFTFSLPFIIIPHNTVTLHKQ